MSMGRVKVDEEGNKVSREKNSYWVAAVYNAGFAAVMIPLLGTTKMLFKRKGPIAHIFCTVSAMVCLSFKAVRPQAQLGTHFAIATLLTYHQFFSSSLRWYAPLTVAVFPGIFLSLHLMFENYLLWMLKTKSDIEGTAASPLPDSSMAGPAPDAPQQAGALERRIAGLYMDRHFRDMYHRFGDIHLLFWAIVPMEGAGILRASWGEFVLMLFVWAVTAFVEDYKCSLCKRLRNDDMALPATSNKCAILMYMPRGAWGPVYVLLLWDLYFIYKYRPRVPAPEK